MNKKKLNIKLDEKVGEGIYANFIMISNFQKHLFHSDLDGKVSGNFSYKRERQPKI